jgi:hypothetical protein
MPIWRHISATFSRHTASTSKNNGDNTMECEDFLEQQDDDLDYDDDI